MMLKTEYKRVEREFTIESLAIKKIVSQIYPVKYCFAINLRFISQGSPSETATSLLLLRRVSQGELKKTLIFRFHK